MNRLLLALGADMALPGGESGGSSFDPLVKPADPADVSLTSGTTDSSGAKRTFSDPTDGSGSYTLAVTIDQAEGSGAVLAGDNSDGWYLTSLEDADVVKVIGTWTDGTTNQKVTASFVTVVADSGSASWVVVDTLAVADLADGGPYTSGANDADYDGETVEVTTVRNGDTGNVEFIQNTGIVITSIGGTITAALYLNDRLPLWARAYSMFGPIAVHVPVDITFSATVDNGVVLGFNDRTTHNNGEFRGCRLRWKSASSEQFQTRIGSNDYNVGGAGDPPDPTFVLTLILHAGVIVEVMRTSGTTPPTPTPGSGIAVTSGGDEVAQQASTIPYDDLYLIVNAVFNAVVTVGQLQIVRWQ